MEITQYKPGMMIEPGQTAIVSDMPNSVYHSHPHVSNSGLSLLARSPAHFKYAPPMEQTQAMMFGSAVHAALLEPDLYESKYVRLKDVKDRRAAEYKAAVEVHGAEFVLMPSDVNKIDALMASIESQPTVRSALRSEGWRELSFFAVDPETAAPVRCRFDLLTKSGLSIDLKTTRDARPTEFSKSVFNYRYHVQEVFYRHVFKCATGEDLFGFKFAAVESEPPHAAKLYTLDATTVMDGYTEFRRLLDLYASCESSGQWPMYGDEEEVISLPDWRLRQIENEIQEEII